MSFQFSYSKNMTNFEVFSPDKFSKHKHLTSLLKKIKMFSSFYLVVETIEKRREPLPTMECIYLITPSEKSVKALMMDFQSQNRTQYRAAHIYFTEGILKIRVVTRIIYIVPYDRVWKKIF